jgi:tetratricopeptide (TPR) repeat protein
MLSLLAAALPAWSVQAPAQPAARVAELVAEGDAARQRQDYDAAIAAYEKAVALDPASVAAHKQLVWTTFLRHTRISDDGKDVDTTGREEALGRLRERYTAAVARDPGNPVLHWALGEVVQHIDGYLAAERHYLDAIERDPGFAEAYQNLALIAEFRGDLAGERKYLAKRVELDPENADAFFYYAMSIQGRKDPAEFRRLAFEVARRFPESSRASSAIAFYAGKAPTPADAISALEELRRMSAGTLTKISYPMTSLFWLYAPDQPEKALELGKAMLAGGLSPGDLKTWQTNVGFLEAMQRARSLLAEGKGAEGLKVLEAAARPRYFDATDLDLLTADLLHASGDTAKAFELMVAREARRPGPRFSEAARRFGVALGKAPQEVADAVTAARDAMAKPAAPFTLHAYRTGKDVSLADYQGRVVLVDFWYPACGPCRGEFPYLQRVAEKYKDRGFVVLALNGHPEEDAFVLPFLDGNQYDFLPLRATEDVVKAYGVRGYPANFLVDRRGRIVFKLDPVADERRTAELERQIEALLAEPEPTTPTGGPR